MRSGHRPSHAGPRGRASSRRRLGGVLIASLARIGPRSLEEPMKHTKRTHLLVGSVIFSLAIGVFAVGAVNEADAQRRLRATLYLVQQAVPRDLNEAGLLRWARSHGTKALSESTSEAIPERHWRGR